MRKIILNLAISLDGFVEGPNGEYDWCFTDQDYGMIEFLNRIDSIFIGRKSYEVLTKSGVNPFKSKLFFLFSNTIKHSENNITLLHSDSENEVMNIKNQKGKDIWLFGGSELTSCLLKANLIDELQLSVHPILLGKGKLLFSDIQSRIQLKLIKNIAYSSGLVQVHYQILC
jgi:dihydrofolate reductase